jgi:hypothetical protein
MRSLRYCAHDRLPFAATHSGHVQSVKRKSSIMISSNTAAA